MVETQNVASLPSSILGLPHFSDLTDELIPHPIFRGAVTSRIIASKASLADCEIATATACHGGFERTGAMCDNQSPRAFINAADRRARKVFGSGVERSRYALILPEPGVACDVRSLFARASTDALCEKSAPSSVSQTWRIVTALP